MSIKNPVHPQEITPEWLTYALKLGGVIKDSSIKNLERRILGSSRGS